LRRLSSWTCLPACLAMLPVASSMSHTIAVVSRLPVTTTLPSIPTAQPWDNNYDGFTIQSYAQLFQHTKCQEVHWSNTSSSCKFLLVRAQRTVGRPDKNRGIS
jgi:hypothetical protein